MHSPKWQIVHLIWQCGFPGSAVSLAVRFPWQCGFPGSAVSLAGCDGMQSGLRIIFGASPGRPLPGEGAVRFPWHAQAQEGSSREYKSMDKKHLTQNERRRIAELLEPGLPLSRIVAALHVARTTISREIPGRRQWQAGQGNRERSFLSLFSSKCSCRRCGSAPDGEAESKPACGPGAPPFAETMKCGRLNRPPYVCNGCLSRPQCRSPKMWYDCKAAHGECRALLFSARKGADLGRAGRDAILPVVLRGLQKRQSPAHSVAASPDAPRTRVFYCNPFHAWESRMGNSAFW